MEALLVVVILATVTVLLSRSVVFVPRGKAAIIERTGKFHRSLSSGIFAIVPFRDKVRVLLSVGEQSTVLSEEHVTTADSKHLQIQCTLRWMITDPEKAVFSITDHHLALMTAARILLLEETAKMAADQVIEDIPAATLPLTAKLRNTALRWGIQLLGIDMVVQTPR